MEKLKYSVAVALVIIFVYACEPPRAIPEIPEVEFKSLLFENTVDLLGNDVKQVKLTISVKDGDGDIGIQYEDGTFYYLEENDTANLFIELLNKENGSFDTVELAIPHYFATRYLEPEGQDKSLIADFETTIQYPIKEYVYDTIKYSFFIYDRAKNKSNIAESPVVPADTLGLIE